MTIGVVVMDYGTPSSRADIARYYTDIRRGHPPTAEQLAELVDRYDAIGGTFPLRTISARQCALIAEKLGSAFVVAAGHKHSAPGIEDAVGQLRDCGVGGVVGLVLAPHYSQASIAHYESRLAAACAGALPLRMIRSWHLLPAYLDHQARAVRHALDGLPPNSDVIFTAHSVPVSTLTRDDPYPRQLRETANAVAERAGVKQWSTAWQSAGRTDEAWLGPDLGDALRSHAQHSAGVLVVACGFVADHLEVAYDLDIEARQLARALELPFARTASVNDDRTVMHALAGLIDDTAKELARASAVLR